MKKNQLAKNLKRLIFEQNITPTQLSRVTAVPQPTIQRIIAGATQRPHISSLEPIAAHFSITIDQLLGDSPLSDSQEPGPALSKLGVNRIPLLNWSYEDIEQWLSNPCTQAHRTLIFNDSPLGESAFALSTSDAAMEPIFPIGCQLTFDPEREVKDRAYVLATTDHPKQLLFRQLLIDGYRYFIKPLSPHLQNTPIVEIKSTKNIIAVLAQAKFNYDS